MSYEQHEWTNGETITAAKMNNIEEGIVEAAQSGGGGGYDLVLTVPYVNLDPEAVEVVSGNVLECEQKVANGEAVNAILIITDEWSFIPSGMNSSKSEYIARLSCWSCGYGYMTFSANIGFGANSSSIRVEIFNVAYDPDDGSIIGINNPYSNL